MENQQLLETAQAILDLLEQIADNTAALAHAPTATEATPGSLPEKLMGAGEVMDYLGITKTTYYRLIKNGELRPRRKGRRHYYYRRDLQAALAESVRRGRV